MLNVNEWTRRLFLALILLLPATGCAFVDGLGMLQDSAPVAERSALQQAEEAFFAGEYRQARELYRVIEEESDNPGSVNQASYGLLCLDIIAARNTHELKRAMAGLEQWRKPEPGGDGYHENPAMMATAMGKQVGLLECQPEIRYVTTKKEGELVKKYQAEIEELKGTIETLEHQISVLETIDQEIQEKRNPL